MAIDVNEYAAGLMMMASASCRGCLNVIDQDAFVVRLMKRELYACKPRKLFATCFEHMQSS
jgi:hypothetical protein